MVNLVQEVRRAKKLQEELYFDKPRYGLIEIMRDVRPILVKRESYGFPAIAPEILPLEKHCQEVSANKVRLPKNIQTRQKLNVSGSYADLTNHPALYKNTYWGTFKANDFYRLNSDDILRNRNEFKRKFGIVRVDTSRSLLFRRDMECMDVFDHVEIYLATGGRRILVTSPYFDGGHSTKAEKEDKLVTLGLDSLPAMYCDHALTYYREFDNLGQLKNFCKYGTILVVTKDGRLHKSLWR